MPWTELRVVFQMLPALTLGETKNAVIRNIKSHCIHWAYRIYVNNFLISSYVDKTFSSLKYF